MLSDRGNPHLIDDVKMLAVAGRRDTLFGGVGPFATGSNVISGPNRMMGANWVLSKGSNTGCTETRPVRMAPETNRISAVATDIPGDECPGSRNRCKPGVVVAISRS